MPSDPCFYFLNMNKLALSDLDFLPIEPLSDFFSLETALNNPSIINIFE